MNRPLRMRLFSSFLLVLLAGMVISAVLSWLAVEQLYLDTQRENLLAQAQLTAATLQEYPIPSSSTEPYSQISNIAPGVHTRLLSEQGAVVIGPEIQPGEPAVQVPVAENVGFASSADVLQRSEVQKALTGIPATAIRRVATAEGRRILYAAVPIQSEENPGIIYLATPLPKNRLPVEVTLQLLGAGLVAVILATITATILARGIARPTENLSKAALAISRGNLEQEVPIETSIQELNDLSRAFNLMTTSLQQSNQAKNAFIADVTHELRTPLTVIKGTTETLEDGAMDDISGRGPLLQAMQRETDRLIRLVNDLLVLTRADTSALQLKTQVVDLLAFAQSRAEQLSPLASSHRVHMKVGMEKSDTRQNLTAVGDPDRLAQILDNLLDNAIRHASPDSIVTVTLGTTGSEIWCKVNNQGASIPQQHLPYIFERFYRVDSSRDRKSGGVGLGLAIVKALVVAQGGRIAVQSSPEQGTTFTLWLPADTKQPVS